MEFFKNIGKALGGAASFVGEKNRRAAYLNRIRTVIRCEEKAAEREYLALGRYYYNNLRDKNNPVTEGHCAELEAIGGRLDKALNQLEQFYEAEKCAREEKCACAVAVIGGEDGPTAVHTAKGGAEIEEVTLEGVSEFDHDPMEPQPEDPAPAAAPAEQDENDSLPFEG